MKTCSHCNQTSPVDAKFCIECGALFQANTGITFKLSPQYKPPTNNSPAPKPSGAALVESGDYNALLYVIKTNDPDKILQFIDAHRSGLFVKSQEFKAILSNPGVYASAYYLNDYDYGTYVEYGTFIGNTAKTRLYDTPVAYYMGIPIYIRE